MGRDDEHSVPRGTAWHRIANMLFPNEPVRRCTERDHWLIDRYNPPYNPGNLKHVPASLLPGGISYVEGFGAGRKNVAPNELIAEVDQAYFRLSLQNEVEDWFAKHGFDLEQPIISKHLFEAAIAVSRTDLDQQIKGQEDASRDTEILELLRKGLSPGKGIQWKKFCEIVRKQCNARPGDLGFSDETIENVTKRLRKKLFGQ